MIRLGCAVIVVLLFAIPAIAARYLPWWGVIMVILGEIFVFANLVPKLLKYGVKRIAMRLFLSKSRVLKSAKVQVHEVRLTIAPVRRRQIEPDDANQSRTEVTAADGTVVTTPVPSADASTAAAADEPESPNNRYVLIDFTLTPVSGTSKMQFYDPSELLLVPYNAKITLAEDPTADGLSASAHDLTLVDESGAEIKDFDKLTGPSHLRITFQCPDSLNGRVKFRYYFEAFGDLALPDAERST
jgi:hypothetical protein